MWYSAGNCLVVLTWIITKNMKWIVQLCKSYIFVEIDSLFFFLILRWTRVCRLDSPLAWSWRCACAQRLTVLTGWPTSSPHVASCCCYATRDTKTTVVPTSGVTSWRRISTRWAGAGSMGRPWGPPRVRSGWCWNVFFCFFGVIFLLLYVCIFLYLCLHICLFGVFLGLFFFVYCFLVFWGFFCFDCLGFHILIHLCTQEKLHGVWFSWIVIM